jgi:hypothetical protein
LSLIRKRIAPTLAMALLLSGLATASNAVAGTIVVRSNGPSAKGYPPGKQMGDNGSIVLKSGDSVTILDGRGTRVLKGPGTFSTTAGSSTAAGSAIGQLLKNTGTRQARTGAVRSLGAPRAARSPNLWYVNAAQSGKFCLADPATATLWRPAMEAEDSLTVVRISDGKTAMLKFNQGQSVKAWPVEDLPITLGTAYRIKSAIVSEPVTIQFSALGPNPQGLEATAAALIKNGCSAQLDLLVDTVALPSAEATSGG